MTDLRYSQVINNFTFHTDAELIAIMEEEVTKLADGTEKTKMQEKIDEYYASIV